MNLPSFSHSEVDSVKGTGMKEQTKGRVRVDSLPTDLARQMLYVEMEPAVVANVPQPRLDELPRPAGEWWMAFFGGRR